jgi:SAM-dependent methyltransferase
LTRTKMLNFGFWSQETYNIKQAQLALCRLTSDMAELDTAKNVVDVGSGYLGPADIWKSEHESIKNLISVDINFEALRMSRFNILRVTHETEILIEPPGSTFVTDEMNITNHSNRLSAVNGTATCLPFVNSFADRIVALESAQHFKSFLKFIQESHRVLKKGGIILIAIPVVTRPKAIGMSRKIGLFDCLRSIKVLGILSLTWASQHYDLDWIKSVILKENLVINNLITIGQSVYIPLADFYLQDRKEFRGAIIGKRNSFFKNFALDIAERILHRSALKMKQLSLSGDIDYVLIKVSKN